MPFELYKRPQLTQVNIVPELLASGRMPLMRERELLCWRGALSTRPPAVTIFPSSRSPSSSGVVVNAFKPPDAFSYRPAPRAPYEPGISSAPEPGKQPL